MIGDTYYEEYKDKIVDLLRKCKFNMDRFEVLQYQ